MAKIVDIISTFFFYFIVTRLKVIVKIRNVHRISMLARGRQIF